MNGTNAITDDAKQLSALQVTATSLVFLSTPMDTAAAPASIEKANLDGSGRTSLYTSAGDRRIHDLRVQGDTAYFFETDNAATIPVEELWSIPLAGGTPSQVGTVMFDEGSRFMGSDDGNLYVSHEKNDAPQGDYFDRVVLGSATIENMAFVAGRGSINMASIVGNDAFFWSATADSASQDIFHFDKTATGATPTALPGGLLALCDIGTAGMFATPTKVACGASGVSAYNHDGSGVTALIAKDPLHFARYNLVASDAETLYILDRGATMAGTGTITKIASSGGAITPVACDVRSPANHLAQASFPISTEYEVTAGATDLYWIEKHLDNTTGSATWSLRHAPK